MVGFKSAEILATPTKEIGKSLKIRIRDTVQNNTTVASDPNSNNWILYGMRLSGNAYLSPSSVMPRLASSGDGDGESLFVIADGGVRTLTGRH